jgi:hypothetical protein
MTEDFSFTISSTSVRELRQAGEATPMMVRPLSLYSFWSSVRWGMDALHGAHQVAQNSTMYTRPFSKPLIGSPFSHFSTCSAGAGSPTMSRLTSGSLALGFGACLGASAAG